MAGIHRKPLLALVACAIIASLALTHSIPETRLQAATKSLKHLELEFIETYNKVDEGIAAVLSGQEIFSGFFISEDGLMLTNGDLARPAAQNPVLIHLKSGERRSAELLFTDPYNHVCLIKAEGRGYKPLPLGSSKDVKVGQFAMTLGNVFGSIQDDQQAVFSVGMVSGLYRLTGDASYSGNVIETDAAVSPGAEGGPMVDIEGRVIGIVAKSYSRSSFLGTAVPIDQVKLVLENMKQKRPIYSGYLGADFKDTVITTIDKGSPAHKGGLKIGDKITEIDTVPINTDEDIVLLLGNSPAGCTSDIAVKRDEEEVFLRITLGKGIKGKEIKSPDVVIGPGPIPADGTPWIGFRLVDKGGGRVEVLTVTPGSPAEKAGISQGLRLLRVNGKIVNSMAAFEMIFEPIRPNQVIILTMENKAGWKRDFKLKVTARAGKEF